MAIIYRTNDLTRWGAGQGANLAASQIDLNFWQLYVMIQGINLGMPVSISSFVVVGSNFYIVLTDGTERGPFQLPLTSWTFRGPWAAATVYSPSDVITNAGAVYLVLFPHTSDSSFSPGANNGMGNNYYGLLSPAAVGIPTAGTTGQVLAKLSNTNYDTGWANTGVPLGGDANQILTKRSGTRVRTQLSHQITIAAMRTPARKLLASMS